MTDPIDPFTAHPHAEAVREETQSQQTLTARAKEAAGEAQHRVGALAADAKAKVGAVAHDLKDRAVRAEQQVETVVRENPGKVVLGAILIGCLVGVVARAAAAPPPPKSRALALLEDIKDRLADMTDPIYDSLHDAADSSAAAVRKGMNRFRHRSLGQRLRDIF